MWYRRGYLGVLLAKLVGKLANGGSFSSAIDSDDKNDAHRGTGEVKLGVPAGGLQDCHNSGF